MRYTATNIRLPENTLKELKIRAAKERKSLAQMIRDAIAHTYHIGEEAPADWKRDPLWKLVGICNSGIKDGSINHDRDIYGPDK